MEQKRRPPGGPTGASDAGATRLKPHGLVAPDVSAAQAAIEAVVVEMDDDRDIGNEICYCGAYTCRIGHFIPVVSKEMKREVVKARKAACGCKGW